MTNANNQALKQAIDNFEFSTARQLLRNALVDADAETYYLGSLVVTDHMQKKELLEQALVADPTYSAAQTALEKMGGTVSSASDPFGMVIIEPSSVVKKYSPPDVTGLSTYLSNGADAYGMELATLQQRFFALVIDVFIIFVLAFIAGFAYGMTLPYEVLESGEMGHHETIANLIGTGIFIIYQVFFLGTQNGQTPGKAVMNIQVIKSNGDKIHMGHAFLRNVLGYWLSSSILVIGFVWALFDGKKQTWHDKIADTIVIKTR